MREKHLKGYTLKSKKVLDGICYYNFGSDCLWEKKQQINGTAKCKFNIEKLKS